MSEKCILCNREDMQNFTLNLNESFITSYLMKSLATPFVDTEAFKLGIIDLNGNQIKKPETMNEQLSYTSIDAYLFKLKKLLGSKSEILNESIYLEKILDVSKLPIELYEKEVQFKSELKIIAQRFKECLQEARNNHLPTELVEKVILENFS